MTFIPHFQTSRRIFLCAGELRKRAAEIIADNLSKAGWSWGCVSAVDSRGRTIWIADAHRDDGKRSVVRVDEKLTAVVGLESAVRGHGFLVTVRKRQSRLKQAFTVIQAPVVTPSRLHRLSRSKRPKIVTRAGSLLCSRPQALTLSILEYLSVRQMRLPLRLMTGAKSAVRDRLDGTEQLRLLPSIEHLLEIVSHGDQLRLAEGRAVH